MHVKIRKAVSRDIPRIVELWKLLVAGHKERFYYDKELFRYRKNSVSLQRKYLTKRLRARNGRVFVAEIDGKIVGYANVNIKKLAPIFVHDREAYINDICIDEAYRRRGIGTKFLKEAEKWTKGKGIFSLALSVFEKNKPGISAYRKFGFKGHRMKMSKVI